MIMSENELKPRIRFKGYTDAWELLTYEKIGTNYTGGSLSYNSLNENGTHKCVLYGDLYTQYDAIIKNITRRTNEKGNTVYQNDILFPQSTTVDAYSLISPACLNEKTAETSGVFVIRPYDFVDGNFVAYYTKGNEKQRNKLAKNAQGLTIVHLYYQSIKDENISLPNLEEQQKISNLLMRLDDLVTLHQRKLEKLKTIKTSLLEKMFPSDGEETPKIRFKGYTDAWELQRLGNSVILNRFSQIGAIELEAMNKGSGDVTLLPSSRNYDWKCSSNDVDSNLINDAEIITVGRARNANTKYSKGKFIASQSHIIESFDKNKLDTKLLYYFIHNHEKEFYSAESTYPMFTKQDFDELKLAYPKDIEEQRRISELLTDIESLCTLHQRKLNKLKIVKKSLLEKMFI